MMSNMPPPATPPASDAGGDLRQILTQLNQSAYHLAQQAAQLAPGSPQLVAQAADLDARLAAVSPRIDTAPPDEQPELAELWTDARLDLDYILSGGSQPTSIRL